jgi:hypothetical protein
MAARPRGVVDAAAGAKTTSATKATSTKGAAKSSASASGGDAQKSLTLDPSVIAKGFEQNGQATQEAGQVASLTSSNNFINFCATTGQTITNGQQVKGGSCNPAPMGSIPSTANMPSAKFKSPKNLDTIQANKNFTVTMNIQGMETGNFVNAEQNYFAAPQQLNSKGQIVGHSHVVIEAIDSITQTTPTDPSKFAFFLGLNAAAKNGALTAVVNNGLPAGTYRLASINTAANHQPCLVPIAQHGSLDDAVYVSYHSTHASMRRKLIALHFSSLLLTMASQPPVPLPIRRLVVRSPPERNPQPPKLQRLVLQRVTNGKIMRRA